MGTFVPTMSSKGWVNTVAEKADEALSNFISSNYSQSVLFYGKIHSLPYLIARYKDANALQSETTTMLTSRMRAYFGERVGVTVTVTVPDPERPAELTIRMSCIVREGNREYSIGREVRTIESRIDAIRKIING